MTSHFDNLHLQSGRTIGEVVNGSITYPIQSWKAKYIIQKHSDGYALYILDEGAREAVLIESRILTFEDAKMAHFNHNIKRLRELINKKEIL